MDGRCEHCRQKRGLCLCAEIPRIETRTRVVILRHALERKKASNTGRLAAMALANSELSTFGAPDAPLDEAALTGPGTWLLYPEGAPAAAPPEPPVQRLIVLDASWQQARRMRQRIAALRGLPLLSLPPGASRARLREAPRPGAMATLEAIAAALGLLEDRDLERRLLALYDLAVERFALPARY